MYTYNIFIEQVLEWEPLKIHTNNFFLKNKLSD